jgi:hypothetical protein
MITRLAALCTIIVVVLVATFAGGVFAQRTSSQKVAQDASKDGVKAATSITGSLGTWELRIIPTRPQDREVTFLMRLRQDGEIVTGDFDCENCPRVVNKEEVAGKAKDGKLYLERASLAHSFFELVITGDQIAGTYFGRAGVRYDVKGRKQEK